MQADSTRTIQIIYLPSGHGIAVARWSRST